MARFFKNFAQLDKVIDAYEYYEPIYSGNYLSTVIFSPPSPGVSILVDDINQVIVTRHNFEGFDSQEGFTIETYEGLQLDKLDKFRRFLKESNRFIHREEDKI